MERKIIKLLGFDVDTFSFESAVNYAKSLVLSKKGGQVITINPEMIETGLKNPEFAQILSQADLVVPDGVGVKLALKLKGKNVQRIAGIEFGHKLLEECQNNNFSVALVGAKPHVIQKAYENLRKEIPNLNIVFYQDGYFDKMQDVHWCMGEKDPQVVLVALGSPRQEKFIYEYRKYHPETLMVGVGGSFDVWAGEVQRAPIAYQKLGLEWLYRTVKEPQRFKRIFPTLPRFLLRVLFSQ